MLLYGPSLRRPCVKRSWYFTVGKAINFLSHATVNIYRRTAENSRNSLRIFPSFADWSFFRKFELKIFFHLFLTVFDFSEYFLDISLQVFIKYCFQCIFVFHRLFFTAFESVKLHELGSHSSYGNTKRPANSHKDWLSAYQIFKQPVLLPHQWNGI